MLPSGDHQHRSISARPIVMMFDETVVMVGNEMGGEWFHAPCTCDFFSSFIHRAMIGDNNFGTYMNVLI